MWDLFLYSDSLHFPFSSLVLMTRLSVLCLRDAWQHMEGAYIKSSWIRGGGGVRADGGGVPSSTKQGQQSAFMDSK